MAQRNDDESRRDFLAKVARLSGLGLLTGTLTPLLLRSLAHCGSAQHAGLCGSCPLKLSCDALWRKTEKHRGKGLWEPRPSRRIRRKP